MGPQASARLITLMVEMCTKEFGIKIDSDFPEIILDSIPVPNFISNKNNSIKAFKILASRVDKLEIFNPVYLFNICYLKQLKCISCSFIENSLILIA